MRDTFAVQVAAISLELRSEQYYVGMIDLLGCLSTTRCIPPTDA